MLNNALTWILFCWICIAKLAPVGYGIKKLQIMLTIVDDLVSVDSLIEERLTVEPCNEYIQSCDIVAFNKIWEPSYWRRAGLLSTFRLIFSFFLSLVVISYYCFCSVLCFFFFFVALFLELWDEKINIWISSTSGLLNDILIEAWYESRFLCFDTWALKNNP
jgi:translation elongation factor EF-1beta